jgi:formate dehydrogenase major subunit
MTGNCRALQQLSDEPGYIQMNPKDAKNCRIKDQQLVKISSRRGSVIARALVSDRVNKGATYMTYQWWIGACNELTLDNLDPISKTPEYKYCSVRVESIEDQEAAEDCIKSEYARIRKEMNIQSEKE